MEMRGCFVKLRLRMNYQEKRENIKLNKGGENFLKMASSVLIWRRSWKILDSWAPPGYFKVRQ